MRLADAPDQEASDGPIIELTPALLRGDARLIALFAPFRECVVLHETFIRDRGAAGATRLLMAEVRADVFDDVRAVVRKACPSGAFTEKPTELDDVAAGTEWRERVGSYAVSVYKLFGGSTALHVTSAKGNAADAPLQALGDSPLAILAELAAATSAVEHVSCSRNAGEAPRWHVQASLRDLRRFEEIAPRLVALGFEERRGKYWRDRLIVQAVGKERWMGAFPGIEFPA
ncbi:hypothetical protein BH11MYX4_BH11MYX4_06550 [soil metagenome]